MSVPGSVLVEHLSLFVEKAELVSRSCRSKSLKHAEKIGEKPLMIGAKTGKENLITVVRRV